MVRERSICVLFGLTDTATVVNISVDRKAAANAARSSQRKLPNIGIVPFYLGRYGYVQLLVLIFFSLNIDFRPHTVYMGFVDLVLLLVCIVVKFVYSLLTCAQNTSEIYRCAHIAPQNDRRWLPCVFALWVDCERALARVSD